MSGVIGASFRSRVGSPACTATVSECGIASAYLKSLEPQDLFCVANAFQDPQPGLHLGSIGCDQRSLAADTGGVRPCAHAIEQSDRSIQTAHVALYPAEGTLGLGLQHWVLVLVANLEDR